MERREGQRCPEMFYYVDSVYQMLLVSYPGGATGSDWEQREYVSAFNGEDEVQCLLSAPVYAPSTVRPA